jgi:hypothetical protein
MCAAPDVLSDQAEPVMVPLPKRVPAELQSAPIAEPVV